MPAKGISFFGLIYGKIGRGYMTKLSFLHEYIVE